MKKHTVSVSVENHPGVLARISGLISSRGFNIASLTVGETEDPRTSCMTIVIECQDEVVEQLMKQLNKLVEVIKVRNLTTQDFVARDLVLVRVKCPRAERTAVLEIAQIFGAKVVDVSHQSLMIEITGKEEKVGAFVDLLRSHGILEMVRTGAVAMSRSGKSK